MRLNKSKSAQLHVPVRAEPIEPYDIPLGAKPCHLTFCILPCSGDALVDCVL